MHEKRCPVPFTACSYPPHGKVHKFESVMWLDMTDRAITRVYVFLIHGIDIPFSWDVLGISSPKYRAFP